MRNADALTVWDAGRRRPQVFGESWPRVFGQGTTGRTARWRPVLPQVSAGVVGVVATGEELNQPDGRAAGEPLTRAVSFRSLGGTQPGRQPVGVDAGEVHGTRTNDRGPLVARGVDADRSAREPMQRIEKALDGVLVERQVGAVRGRLATPA